MKTFITVLFIILSVSIVNAQEIMIGNSLKEIINTNYHKHKTRFEIKNVNGTQTLETDFDGVTIVYIMVNNICTGMLFIFHNPNTYYRAIKIFNSNAKEGVFNNDGLFFHFKIKNNLYTLLIGESHVDW